MEDVLDIQETQVAPPQDDPPIKKLYKGLYADKKYTKSFDEFKKQYSTPEAIDKLYNGLKEDGDYTKSKDDFQVQYFAEVKKKEPTPSGVSVGKLLSQDVEIPIVSLENTEGKNPIDLAQDYQSLKNKQKFPSEEEMGRSMGMAQPVPDEQGQKQAANLKDYLQNNHGIDPEDLYQETKRLQPNDFGRVGFSKEELLKDREENPQLYQRKIGRLNWERDLTDKLSQDLIDNRIDKDTFDRLHSNIQTLAENSNQGDYSNQREAVKSVSQIIQQFGGENKDQMLKDFAVEVGKVYGNSYNNKFTEATKDNPENKYLDNDFEKLGLQYIQDVDPEKAAQYDKLKIDPKTYKDNYDAVQGANHLHQTLAETGIALQENSVNEELNSLSKIADQNGGLDEIQLAKAKQLQEKQLWLQAEKFDLDKKYPERKGNKVNDAVQEILGQDLSWSKYAGLKTGSAINNTLEGIWEGVTSPFMSDASNTIRELAIMGSEPDFHLTDKNKSLQTDKLIINPELQPQIDAIKNDKTLTPEQKKGRMFDLLYHNTDKFGRVPISGGKFNISPSSILYGLTDLGATLVPFLTMEAVTGGGATASAGRKFLSTFTAAAATSFHEEYAAAIKEGVPQSEAYKRAMGMTAITSLAMAGAGTPQALREMAGTKTSAGKIISQMSDAELKKGLEDATKNKTMTALRNRLKATPQMAKEGLKTGLKFEGLMTAANEAKHQIYNTDIDREHNFKQSILNVANFGIIGTGLGHIGYEAPTDLQKSGLLKMGEKPDDFHFTLQEMKKDGGITQSEFDHRTELIDKAKEAYKTIPKANDKGIPLSETEKGEYLYNSVVKNEGKKAASTMPPKQAEKAEHTAMVADHENSILLSSPTDKQLEDRKVKIERKLELNSLNDESKVKLSDKEVNDLKAEKEAIDNVIEKRSVTVADENAKRLLDKKEVNTEEIKIPAYKEIFTNGTSEEKKDALKDISDQWHDEGTREVTEKNFGKALTEKAVKEFPQESQKSLSIEEAKTDEVPIPEKEGSITETELSENILPTTEGKEEPPKPPSEEVITEGAFVEPKRTTFSHKGLQEVATEFGLNDVSSRERVTDLELFKGAEETINKWTKEGSYEKNVNGLIEKAKAGEIFSPEQNVIMAQHIAQMRERAAQVREKFGINSPEYNQALRELQSINTVGQKVRSDIGAALRVPTLSNRYVESLDDAMTAKMEANSTETLTPTQKAEVEKQFNDIKKAKEEAEAKLTIVEDEYAKYRAEQELKKGTYGKKNTSTKRDYKAETKSLVDKLKQQFDEFKAEGQKLGIASNGGATSFVLSAKMAKTIGEIIKIKVEEVGHDLKEVVKRTLDELKAFPEITERHIRDVIAGEYNEKRKTRSQLAADMRDITDEQKYINKLERLLAGTEPKNERQRIERNRQITELKNKIKDFKKEETEANKFYKEEYDEDTKKLISIKKRNEAKAKKIRDDIAKGNFEKEKKLSWIDNPEFKKKHPQAFKDALDAFTAKEDAQHDFDVAIYKDQLKQRYTVDKSGSKLKTVGSFAKVGGRYGSDFLGKAANTTKKIVTGVDDSALGIQTLAAMLARPLVGAKALKLHALDAFSKKRFNRGLAELHNSRDWDLMKKSGLDVTEPKSLSEQNKEEIFGGNTLDIKFKLKGKEYKVLETVLEPFERGFTSLGNGMRVIAFRTMAEKLEKEGYTFEKNPQKFKDLAQLLNTETGRGKQNEYIQQASELVTKGIWSPKLMASRLNMLGISDLLSLIPGKTGTKGYYRTLDPTIRKEAIKDVVKFAGSVVALSYLVAWATGGELDTDPRSQTYMDIKVGDKSYNLSGGFSQYIRLVAQTVSGGKTSNGNFHKFERDKDVGTNALHFLRGKTTPIAGVGIDLATGKDFAGNPITLAGEAAKLTIPLSLNSVADGIKRDGYSSLFTTTLPNFVGVNVKDKREYVDQDLKVPEWKFLSDKGLKLIKHSKESLRPVDENGNLIEVTKDKYDDFVKKREEYIRKDVEELLSGKGYLEDDGTYTPLSAEEAKKLTYDELKAWLMTKTEQANDKAIYDVFKGEQAPKAKATRKIATD